MSVNQDVRFFVSFASLPRLPIGFHDEPVRWKRKVSYSQIKWININNVIFKRICYSNYGRKIVFIKKKKFLFEVSFYQQYGWLFTIVTCLQHINNVVEYLFTVGSYLNIIMLLINCSYLRVFKHMVKEVDYCLRLWLVNIK